MAPPTAPTPAPMPACMRAPVGIVFATRPRLPLMAEPMAEKFGAAFFSFPFDRLPATPPATPPATVPPTMPLTTSFL